MSDTKDLKLSYTGVSVHGAGLALITTVRDDVEDEVDVDHELVYIYEQGDWAVYDAKDRNVVSATFDASGDEIALLSPEGHVLRLLPKSTVREEVDPSDDGPSSLVQMRHMRRWMDAEVAVGMARRVYERRQEGRWRAIDQGCFLSRDRRNAAIGFNAVDGWNSGSLIAVGYKGEIWARYAEAWTQLDSPCNATLTSVACASEGRIFAAVGLAGVVMVGSESGIRLVDTTPAPGAFWSVVHFANSFFIAGDSGVVRLDGPTYDTLQLVSLTTRGTPSTGFLACAPGALWSVGDEDIFASQDGIKWRRIPGP